MIQNIVVARYLDGRIVKGTSLNVDPDKPTFHVRTEQGPAVEVKLRDLKALFFVKDLVGNSMRNESADPTPGDSRLLGARRVCVEFRDGETLTGTTPRFPPIKQFFYVIPIDPKSNNLRVLVNRHATAHVREAGTAAHR
jgi:hypothetical protein